MISFRFLKKKFYSLLLSIFVFKYPFLELFCAYLPIIFCTFNFLKFLFFFLIKIFLSPQMLFLHLPLENFRTTIFLHIISYNHAESRHSKFYFSASGD